TDIIPRETKVLVTGAAGFTASRLVRKLISAGFEVNAIVRKNSDTGPIEGLNARLFRGNVYDPHIVRSACSGVKYVFHLATVYRKVNLSDDEYYKVHVESTRLLAEAALCQPGFKRFLHTSTTGVYGDNVACSADEACIPAPSDISQKTKLEAELVIREFIEKRGLSATIIRPVSIYGPGDTRVFKLFKMVAQGWVPLVSNRNILYHLIHVADLIDFYLHCAVFQKAKGETFICGNTQCISIKDIVSVIARCYNKRVHFVNIPQAPLLLAAYICEKACKKIGVEPPLHCRRAVFFTKDHCFNTAKMRDYACFTPKISVEEGICQTAKWYLAHGWLRLGSKKAGLR
ncbi:MAG: NAD-dependent epimerase/dehydratase family protein, partial [Candidatus Omnitrophica bacterium]|nr:NAD-dependent epimerase/dehydratase family protein [Candidatus Omnitrophota bacterium]